MLQKTDSLETQIDKHVAARVRQRRMQLGRSQEWLGDHLGVTWQQAQKNEKGVNRIGCGRLRQIAHALAVPESFFFEGAPGPAGAKPSGPSPAIGADFLATRDGLALATAFQQIDHPALRRRIVDLVEQFVAASPKG